MWLVKAIGLSFVAALVCAWLAVCLLYYQGEWQLVLHPTHTVDRTPKSAGLDYEDVRFDVGETGQPLLTGWFVPAAEGAKYADVTVLYLHDGSLSLAATVPTLARLHAAGLNVFAFDYRGFGLSDGAGHPTEARMTQDAVAALEYLLETRHIAIGQIVPYGTGLGASLAVGMARSHGGIRAVVVDNPDPDPTATAMGSRPSRVVPIRLLFRERFEIAGPLSTLATPKLLIAGGPNSTNGAATLRALQVLFHGAASPTLAVTLPPANYDSAFQTAVTRFLDEYMGR